LNSEGWGKDEDVVTEVAATDTDESVDLLGFWFETKAYEKNIHRHPFDIPRFFSHNEGTEPDSVDFERQ
jgi:hypothetical protein